jgi:uncharacterized metal-binding protein
MSDGKTHDRWGLGTAAILALGVAISMWKAPGHWTTHFWGLPGGILLGTLLLSPDLDMWNTRPMKRWGPLRLLWAPYAWLHKHRGISHSWIIGPATRLLYIGLPIALIWLYWDFKGAGEWLAWLVLGVYLANWLHLAQDRHWPWS